MTTDTGSQTQAQRPALSPALAQAVDELEAIGLENMPWRSRDTEPGLLQTDWLMHQPLLPFLVQVTPAQVLYFSLLENGLENSLEVIEWLRGDKLTHVLDYDLWARDNDKASDEIVPARALNWLHMWLQIGSDFAAERVAELEEETLILFLTSLLDLQPEGIGRPEPGHEDDYWQTADGRFHLRLKPGIDPGEFDSVKELIDALYAKDIRLAQTILAHGAMLVRDETLESASHWRRARLADAGFAARDEALHLLSPRASGSLLEQIRKAIHEETRRREFSERAGKHGSSTWFSEEVEERRDAVRETLRSLAPERQVSLALTALGSEEVLKLSSGVELTTQNIDEEHEILEETVERVTAQALTLVWTHLNRPTAPSQSTLLLDRTFAFIAEQDPQAAAELKARVAHVSNLVAAAASSAIEWQLQKRAISIARGAMNVGLQTCLRTKLFEESAAGELATTVEALRAVGPEFLFRLGWAEISAIGTACAEAAQNLDFPVAPPADLAGEIRRQRFLPVRRWLDALEGGISVPVHLVLSSFLNRFPLFPTLLSAESAAASGERRPFETMDDLELARQFVENLPRLSIN